MLKFPITLILCMLCGQMIGQHILSGTISSGDRSKLIGASIFFEGTSIAAVSEGDGTYYIEDIPTGDYTVEFSYVGYEDKVLTLSITEDMNLDVELDGTFYELDQIQISDSRLNEVSPFTYSELSHEQLQEKNTGVDVPFLLNGIANVQTTSDAGAGIGYTSIRLRGSDQTRINVTINGVPLNDAESQNVFWVDLPDFASSVDNIQVQRGVGTSTNGPGAFGGTVGLNTHTFNGEAYAEVGGTIGSFNTNKVTVKLGTGILNDRFSVDGRYSLVNSDGYIDRSDANLNSWMISPAVYWDDAVLRMDIFSGHEVTNQAWFGVPESRLGDDRAALDEHFVNNFFPGGLYQTTEDSLNFYNSDRRYNYYLYENQVDDYQQDHVQLHYYKNFADNITSRLTGYFTHGFGFFEEFRINDELDFYALPLFTDQSGDTIVSNDIIRRRNLDNTLLGFFTNNQIELDKMTLDLGGGLSRYRGGHDGYAIEVVGIATPNFLVPYYSNEGTKVDYNVYAKSEYALTENVTTVADVQLRGINYRIEDNIEGIRADNKIETIDYSNSWLFFNPKLGVTYHKDNLKAYASVAVANREPDRNDILAALDREIQPQAETLYDGELGFVKGFESFNVGANAYYMYYQNQLVLNGELNDVGANLRTNVDESFRAGVEIEANTSIGDILDLNGNLALSRNKISNFDEIVFNFVGNDVETVVNSFEDVDISFSPNIVAYAQAKINFLSSFDLAVEGKYVGQQFLDNTQNEDRVIPEYFVSNASIGFNPTIRNLKNVGVRFHVNNLFSTLYSANGYTYSFGVDDFFITENFYYPQAERHFLLTATIKI